MEIMCGARPRTFGYFLRVRGVISPAAIPSVNATKNRVSDSPVAGPVMAIFNPASDAAAKIVGTILDILNMIVLLSVENWSAPILINLPHMPHEASERRVVRILKKIRTTVFAMNPYSITSVKRRFRCFSCIP